MAQTPEKKSVSTNDESSWLKLVDWAVAIEPELKKSVINKLNSVRPCYLVVLESDMDDTEEVIYSEGEPFEGYQYPNNTWDSDDSIYEEDWVYFVC